MLGKNKYVIVPGFVLFLFIVFLRSKDVLYLEHTVKIWEWLLSHKKSQLSSGIRNLPCLPHSSQTESLDDM